MATTPIIPVDVANKILKPKKGPFLREPVLPTLTEETFEVLQPYNIHGLSLIQIL